ncbi:hypothetical protein HK096_002283, partial [Nowakowskiella sp. JEL0078]
MQSVKSKANTLPKLLTKDPFLGIKIHPGGHVFELNLAVHPIAPDLGDEECF